MTPELPATSIASRVSDDGRILFDETWAKIDRAAPYMDAGCPANVWKPSMRLTIFFSAAITAGRLASKPWEIIAAVESILDKSRQRYRAGLHPNPYDDAWSSGVER